MLKGKTISINWDLLEKLNDSGFQKYVHQPLPCNTVLLENYSNYLDDPFLVGDTKRYSFNGDCFRSRRNISLEKPRGVFRVIILGDSYVYGYGLDDNETLTETLERELNSQGNYSFQVINLGVSCYNTKLEVQRLLEKGLKYNPDVVILAYVRFDYLPDRHTYYIDRFLFGHPRQFSQIQSLVWNAYLNRYINYDTSSKNYSEYKFKLLYNISVTKPLEELVGYSKEYNFFLLVISYSENPKEKSLLLNLSQRIGYPLIFLDKEIGYKAEQPWVLNDKDTHPSVFANKKIARFLFEYLKTHFSK